MGKINILFFFEHLGIGGQNETVFTVARALDERKFNKFICYTIGGIYEERAKKHQIHLIKIANLNTRDLSLINFRNIPKHSYIVLKVLNLIKNFKIDIILTTCNYSYVLGGIAAKISRTSHVWMPGALIKTIGGVFGKLFPKLGLHHLADMFIVGIKTMKEELINYDVNTQKIKLVPYGIDLRLFDHKLSSEGIRNEFNIEKDCPVVGIISRIVPDRGHDVLIKAARKILKYNIKTKFFIVGDDIKDGTYRKHIEEMAKVYGVYDNFIFTGWRTDIPRIISALDIGVLVPKDPTGGVFLREAMACAKPIITTDGESGAQRSWIKHGVTGILIPPKNMDDHLANAIIDLLNDKAKAKTIGVNARKYTEKYADLNKTVKEIEKVFIELVDK